jgi:acyl-coenzyme A synthetase/AMP-(fatty) acid ligase
MNPAPAPFNFSKDVVEEWGRRAPDSMALWWVDEGGQRELKFSFAEMSQQLRRAAHFFHSNGVKSGDRVLVILHRVPHWWAGVLGLIRLGAVPIPGTPLLTPRDIAYRLEAAEVSAVLTDAEGAEKFDGLKFDGRRFLAGDDHRAGWLSFEDGVQSADAAFDPPPTPSDAPGLIYFTSGTTGEPKMVLHTQASYGLGHRTTGQYWLDLRPTDVHWNLSDTGWAKAAWSSLFAPWHMGACIFVVDARGKFDPAATLRTLASYPISTWCAPPTALRRIVREDLSKYRFQKLRHCVSAGEPLNPEVIDLWRAATGLTIYEGYGQTETVCLIAHSRSILGDEVRPGSMGKPIPGHELAVLDGEMNQVGPGLAGQLAVRVKPHRPLGLFKEYWKNPAENAARFVGDYYLTGDVAKRDTDGFYWFVGRADDVIKSSGYRIGPFEVESALIEHPAVVEAAVVGVADAERGQIVKAFVVLRKDVSACEELKSELQEHCKRITAPYKYPREIEFMSELPKTISGKIRRVELRGRGSS